MITKIIKYLEKIIILLLLCFSCKNSKDIIGSGNSFVSYSVPYQYPIGYEDYIFNNWIHLPDDVNEIRFLPVKDIGGYREGYMKNGVQEGIWKHIEYSTSSEKYIAREEYFKNGLRDSVFNLYDDRGKLLYSTYFNQGTGIEKGFYNNGQLYYEIKTQNGFFTDTLILYDKEGQLMEKLFYSGDSLLYRAKVCKERTFPIDIDEAIAYTNYIFFNWFNFPPNVKKISNLYVRDSRGNSGRRYGYVKNNVQDGLWQYIKSSYIDSIGNCVKKEYLSREEYFESGLRDSIFNIYDNNGKLLYSTYFNQGTGIEKDFHTNGQLYYEIETKDGYFTDTLKLYDKEGYMMEKLFYIKDSLVYHEKIDKDGFSTVIKK